MKEQRYRSTIVDKYGPLAVESLGRSLLAGIAIALFVALGLWSRGVSGLTLLGVVVAAGLIGTLAAAALTTGTMEGAGYVAKKFFEGSSEYERDYSRHDALAVSGRAPEALVLYESEIEANSGAVAPRFRAAELYLQQQNPTRAVELLRQIQRLPDLRQEDDVRASYRLMDIYQGAARDDGRVLVELRRLIDRYPHLPAASTWRSAIADLQKSRA